MTVGNISWYLCVLFAIALAVSSAITVVPDGQAEMRLLMGTCATLSMFFAAVALAFKRLHLSQPKWLLRVLQCLAILTTLAVLMLIGG